VGRAATRAHLATSRAYSALTTCSKFTSKTSPPGRASLFGHTASLYGRLNRLSKRRTWSRAYSAKLREPIRPSLRAYSAIANVDIHIVFVTWLPKQQSSWPYFQGSSLFGWPNTLFREGLGKGCGNRLPRSKQGSWMGSRGAGTVSRVPNRGPVSVPGMWEPSPAFQTRVLDGLPHPNRTFPHALKTL